MANRVRPIEVSAADRAKLERLQRASSTRAGLSRRVRTILLMLQGHSGVEIAERVGYTVVQVSWVRRRPPVIVPAPLPDFTDATCGFPVLHFTTNAGTAKIFRDGTIIITGKLVATYSGLGRACRWTSPAPR